MPDIEIRTNRGTIDMSPLMGKEGRQGPTGPGADVTGAEIEAARDEAVAAAADAVTAAASAAPDPHDVGLDGLVWAGQSNARGWGGPIDTMLDVPSDRVKQWPGSGTYVGQVIAGIEPLFHRDQGANTVGSGTAFARKYLQTVKPNRAACILPAAMGSTGFTTSSLNPPPSGYTYVAGGGWDPSGAQGGINLFQALLDQITAFLVADPKNRLTCMVWHQGEADITLTQAQYAAKLDALIAGVRALPGVPSDLPVIVIQMIPERVASGGAPAIVNAAHVQTQARLVRTAFVYGPAGMNLGDNLHYSAAGQRKIGNDLLLPALLRARANVLGVAPVPPAGVTLTQSGTTVTARLRRPEGRFTDFATEYRRNGGAWTAVASPTDMPVDITRTISGLGLGDAVDVRVHSVNEAGVSAWTTSTLTLANAPQAPSITSVTPAVSSASVAFAPAASGPAATSYRLDYRTAGSNSWAAGPVVTSSPGTILGLAPATNYEASVVPTNAAGDGTRSAASAFSTPAPTALSTDMGMTPDYSWGVARRLVAGYSGPGVKVRRSSDNTTQDVAFLSGGDLDVAALTTFVGSGSGYLDTIYDQSGNGRHLVMATAAAQPRIVNAGTVETKAGKPCGRWDGTDDVMDWSGVGLWAAGATTALAVLNADTDTPLAAVFLSEGTTVTANAPRYVPARFQTGGAIGGEWISDNNGTLASIAGGSGDLRGGGPRQVTVRDTGTTHAVWTNGTVHKAPTTYTARTGTLTMNVTSVGAVRGRGNAASGFLKGTISELVAFRSAVSDTARQAGETNQLAYYGIS